MATKPGKNELAPINTDLNILKTRPDQILTSADTLGDTLLTGNTSKLNLNSPTSTDLDNHFSNLEIQDQVKPLPEKKVNPAKKAIKGIGHILFPFAKWKSGSVTVDTKKGKNPIRKWDTYHIKDAELTASGLWKQQHALQAQSHLDSRASGEYDVSKRPKHLSTDVIPDEEANFIQSQASSDGKGLSSQSSAVGPRLLSSFGLADISYTSSMGDLAGSSGTITSSAHTYETNGTPPETGTGVRANSGPPSLNTKIFQKLGKVATDLFPDEKDGEFSGDYTALLNISRFRRKYSVSRINLVNETAGRWGTFNGATGQELRNRQSGSG